MKSPTLGSVGDRGVNAAGMTLGGLLGSGGGQHGGGHPVAIPGYGVGPMSTRSYESADALLCSSADIVYDLSGSAYRPSL